MSLVFKLIKVGLAKYGLLSNDMHFVANDMLELNNEISTCLIDLNIILNYSFSLNIYEY